MHSLGVFLFFCPQSFVAKMLGVPVNRILVRVKRMGGGFEEGDPEHPSNCGCGPGCIQGVPMGSGEENKAASCWEDFLSFLCWKVDSFCLEFAISPLFIELLSIGVKAVSPSSLCPCLISFIWLWVMGHSPRPITHTRIPYLVQHSALVEKEGSLALFWDSPGSAVDFSPSGVSPRTGHLVLHAGSWWGYADNWWHPFLARYKVLDVRGCAG